MGNSFSWGTPGNNTSISNVSTTLDLYKLPYISSAINVNTENLQKCLENSITSAGDKMCIHDNIKAAVKNPSSEAKLNIAYFGPGRTYNENITTVTQNQYSSNPGELVSKTIQTTMQESPGYPTSGCYEKFESDNDGNYDTFIQSKKIFCFNGTFTIMTIFILVLLLIFINVSSKK